ncbi:hypothetical protein MSG28_016086 [Choristoneura fumiferana]|uniref:Uncharacterized protein n=1 Tax=Choristoneura fumiferana TaxID=7141 RepID=A0ACC0K5S5_CHOFU|nr:hypothetical protein MSG28_016086 [Choristoneura fumiferana]
MNDNVNDHNDVIKDGGEDIEESSSTANSEQHQSSSSISREEIISQSDVQLHLHTKFQDSKPSHRIYNSTGVQNGHAPPRTGSSYPTPQAQIAGKPQESSRARDAMYVGRVDKDDSSSRSQSEQSSQFSSQSELLTQVSGGKFINKSSSQQEQEAISR